MGPKDLLCATGLHQLRDRKQGTQIRDLELQESGMFREQLSLQTSTEPMLFSQIWTVRFQTDLKVLDITLQMTKKISKPNYFLPLPPPFLFCLFVYVFQGRFSLCSSGYPGTCFVDQGRHSEIHPPLLPNWWNQRCVLPLTGQNSFLLNSMRLLFLL